MSQKTDIFMPRVLDPCCGSRMMWFDHKNPYALFGDQRVEDLTVTDSSRIHAGEQRVIHVSPDVRMDFRSLPFPDETFRLVVFDPPHLRHVGAKSWLAAKYGQLGTNWREDLRLGFSECFRVLEREGILIFKWAEVQIKTRDVLSLAPYAPLFGHVSGKKSGTHWMTFMKYAQAKKHCAAIPFNLFKG